MLIAIIVYLVVGALLIGGGFGVSGGRELVGLPLWCVVFAVVFVLVTWPLCIVYGVVVIKNRSFRK